MEMGSQELWRFINSFAPWLAAVGTIAAVITSLYLARKDFRIDIRLRAGVRTLAVMGDGPGHGTEWVSLFVTNAGRRVATVSQLYWKTGVFRKQMYVWIAPRNPYSSTVPVKLSDGEQATYMLPIREFEKNMHLRAKDAVSGLASRLKVHFIRVGVCTSTGEGFEARIEKSLRDLFVRMAKQS